MWWNDAFESFKIPCQIKNCFCFNSKRKWPIISESAWLHITFRRFLRLITYITYCHIWMILSFDYYHLSTYRKSNETMILQNEKVQKLSTISWFTDVTRTGKQINTYMFECTLPFTTVNGICSLFCLFCC